MSRRFEVLAAGRTAVAGMLRIRGRLRDGGGPFELDYGAVLEVREGQLAAMDLFEPDDRDRLLARQRELG